MNDIHELESRIDNCINILNKARSYFAYCRYFINKDLTQEEKNLINQFQIIRDFIHSSWVITILELCKLLDDSPNHKLNLFKLFRCIRNDWHNLKINERISLQDFNELERALFLTKFSERIVSIKILRDRYYAHTDPVNQNPEIELIPNFEKVNALIIDIIKVLSDLKINLLKTTYFFGSINQANSLFLKFLLKGSKTIE